jgi:hypothetical protein
MLENELRQALDERAGTTRRTKDPVTREQGLPHKAQRAPLVDPTLKKLHAGIVIKRKAEFPSGSIFCELAK